MNIVKTKSEVEKIRKSSKIVATIHEEIKKVLKPNLIVEDLSQLTINLAKKHNAWPSFLYYRGYPYPLCVSINNEIVHGFPKNKIIKSGDIVSIDVGIEKDGYHGDAAFTTIIGNGTEEDRKLVDYTERCLYNAINIVRDGVKLTEIGAVIEETAKEGGFDVVRNYIGHGIGRQLHEPPSVYNYPEYKETTILRAGMVIAIEPMLVKETSNNMVLSDQWTVVTVNGYNAAHYEHTVLVKKDGYEILSKL